MNEVELLENLLEAAKKVSYDTKDEFYVLKKRTEMIIIKLFGTESHYLKDINTINFKPVIIFSDETLKTVYEDGLVKFRNVIKVMIEDKKLSNNYDDKKTSKFIKSENIIQVKKEAIKEIKVLIASPSDVVTERVLLLDKIETKFRRDHYEDRCKARIIVDGWEFVPSQTGYAQDIINSDLVKNANIILAVFRHKLGSPTIDIKTGKDRSSSGTAEELLYAIRNKAIKDHPLGMAYFYTNAPSPSLDSIDFNIIQKDWIRLKEFKEEIKNEILYKTYNIEEEILELVCKDICDNIIKYFN